MMCCPCGPSVGGDRGVLMQGSSAGRPGFMAAQPSSLPMNNNFASLRVRTCRTVLAASVG